MCNSSFVVSMRSELEPRLAGGIRQRLDAAVVGEAGAVERDRLDAGSQGPLGDALADPRGGGDAGALAGRLRIAGEALAHLGLERRGAREDAGAVVGDQVRVDVQVAAMHRQARGALL